MARRRKGDVHGLTPEEEEAAARQLAIMARRGGAAVVPLPAGDGRPHFADDREYGLWLIDHRDQADAAELEWLESRLESTSFRLWLDLDDEPAAAGGLTRGGG